MLKSCFVFTTINGQNLECVIVFANTLDSSLCSWYAVDEIGRQKKKKHLKMCSNSPQTSTLLFFCLMNVIVKSKTHAAVLILYQHVHKIQEVHLVSKMKVSAVI